MTAQDVTGTAGDSFAAFVASRQRRLQRTAWLLTGDWSAAQDLVQTALARTWRHWERVRTVKDPDAYVRRVLVNSFASSLRRRWRAEVPTRDLPERPGGDLAAEVALRVTIQSALSHLTKRQRAVVVLRYVEDLSEAQVADVLGCAVGTVKSTGNKALTRLRADPGLAGLLEGVRR
jgi:RNA polymerase sigma-70 factor (sigma-E family)